MSLDRSGLSADEYQNVEGGGKVKGVKEEKGRFEKLRLRCVFGSALLQKKQKERKVKRATGQQGGPPNSRPVDRP